MLDAYIRPLIDRALDRIGRSLAAKGITADQITIASFAAGLAGSLAIAVGAPLAALCLILAGRVGDGLDGAVARATKKTDRGGFLDIVLDFMFYASVPVAFAVLDPNRNALPAAILLASFMANGSTFLAFAIMAAKRNLETTAQGQKSLFYSGGLVEGTETIAFFVAFLLLPKAFPWLAGLMAVLCFGSATIRIATAYRVLG